MKILVTGADGLLGSNLVRMLLQDNHIVSVLLHPSSSAKTLAGLKIAMFHGDILKPETLESAISGQDAIIHAAALTDVWPNRSEIVRRVNIEGTSNMLKGAIKHEVSRFVYVGSASSAAPDHGAQHGLDYIDSKYEALQLVVKAAEEKQIESICIMPTFMIGAYDSKPSSGKMIQTLALGKLKFYSKGGRNFVFVKDVAQAIINSLTMGENGKAYVAGNANLSYRSFFQMVSEVVGKPPPKIPVPNWLVKLIGGIGSFVATITGKAPMLSFAMAKISTIEQFVDSSDAVNELKMPQTNLNIAIDECYQWFKKNNYC